MNNHPNDPKTNIDQSARQLPPSAFPTGSSLLLYFLQGSRLLFAGSILFAALTALFDLLNPRIIGFTVDSILDDKKAAVPAMIAKLLYEKGLLAFMKENPWTIALLVTVTALMGGICRYLFRMLNTRAAETLVKSMRDKLFAHIGHLPFTWYVRNDTGDIIQRCTSDVETVKRFLADQLTGLLRIIVLLAFALRFMWSISPSLTLPAAAFIPVIVAYSVFFRSRISRTFEKADHEEGVLSSYAQENLTGVRVVRAFGRERYEKERFAAQNEIYTNAYMKLCILLSAYWSAGDLFSGLQVLTVVLLGAVMTVHGRISAGDYIAFVSYNAILVWPVRQLGRVISDMSKAGVSVDRIRYIMNSPAEEDTPDASEPPLDGDIVFEHVTFGYDPAREPLLRDVSFTVKAGTTTGILGGTGSGKSTLVHLLKRMYELPENGGRIMIGGNDIRTVRLSHLRRNVGLVLQEPFLFSRTIEENIAIAAADADPGKIRRAAHAACLDETVERFADGYRTAVGERGVTLSGGQKQRTAIAQMLMTDPPVMIFDDSLSAVDTRTDALIRQRLKEVSSGATVILISHRINTLMHADQIVVLNRGRVAEKGTHRQLLAQGGLYSRIASIQSEGKDNA